MYVRSQLCSIILFLVKRGGVEREEKKIIKFFGHYDLLLGIGRGGGTLEGPAPEGPGPPDAPPAGAAPG